ncbi:26352_t:CDS:2, partial [Dentiscutata erythropus]
IGPQFDTDNMDKTRLERETQRSNSNSNIGSMTPKVSSNFEEQEENIEDIDAYLPALPPDILAERQRKKEEQGKKTSGIKETTYKRQIGPTMPLNINDEYQNSEEEEIIGPVFPKDLDENDDKYALERTIQEFEERSERMRSSLEDEKSEKRSGRGEWMLVPPPQVRYL